jgi:hypothetical protein
MVAVHFVQAVSWVLAGGLVVAIAAAVLRRWSLATRVSRGIALGAAATFGAVLLLMVISTVSAPRERKDEPEYSTVRT